MSILLSRVLTVNNLGWFDFYMSLIIVIFIGALVLSIEE